MLIGSPKGAVCGIICHPLNVPSIAPKVLQEVKPNYMYTSNVSYL